MKLVPNRSSDYLSTYGDSFGVWVALGDGFEPALSTCAVCGFEWEEV